LKLSREQRFVKNPKLGSIFRLVSVFFGSELVLAGVLKATNHWDWTILIFGGLAVLAIYFAYQIINSGALLSRHLVQEPTTTVEQVSAPQIVEPTFSLGKQRAQGREYFAGIPVSVSDSAKNLTEAQADSLYAPYYNKWTHIAAVVHDITEPAIGTTTIYFVGSNTIHAMSFNQAWKDKVLLLSKGDAFEAEGCFVKRHSKSLFFDQSELRSWNGAEITLPNNSTEN
jgi:amino acid transporter